MGLLKGSLSLSRYQVQGSLPSGFWQWAGQQISKNIFMDIEGTTEAKSLGWVGPLDYFDTSFAYESYNLNPYLVLGIRLDKRALSARLLNKYHRLEMARARAENPEFRLGKPEREMLKEKVRLSLMLRIPLQTTFWEMCWNTQTNEVWFATCNRAQLELSQELFNHTFAPLILLPRAPFLLAGDLLPKEQRAALEQLNPLGI